MKTYLLKAELMVRRMSLDDLASLIGMGHDSLYRRMNGTVKITCEEATAITDALKLSEKTAFKIFLEK